MISGGRIIPSEFCDQFFEFEDFTNNFTFDLRRIPHVGGMKIVLDRQSEAIRREHLIKNAIACWSGCVCHFSGSPPALRAWAPAASPACAMLRLSRRRR